MKIEKTKNLFLAGREDGFDFLQID